MGGSGPWGLPLPGEVASLADRLQAAVAPHWPRLRALLATPGAIEVLPPPPPPPPGNHVQNQSQPQMAVLTVSGEGHPKGRVHRERHGILTPNLYQIIAGGILFPLVIAHDVPAGRLAYRTRSAVASAAHRGTFTSRSPGSACAPMHTEAVVKLRGESHLRTAEAGAVEVQARGLLVGSLRRRMAARTVSSSSSTVIFA